MVQPKHHAIDVASYVSASTWLTENSPIRINSLLLQVSMAPEPTIALDNTSQSVCMPAIAAPGHRISAKTSRPQWREGWGWYCRCAHICYECITKAFFLLVVLRLLVEIFADSVCDSGLGYCVQDNNSGYECKCLNGYEGELCDKPVFNPRLVRDTDSFICNMMPCQNGGTCIPVIDKGQGEAGMEIDGEAAMEGEAAVEGEEDEALTEEDADINMDGEAPVNMGEASFDCDVEGNCFTCTCAQGFTGYTCSETIGTHTLPCIPL